MRCPLLNPIRFYELAKVPDWSTYFPNPNNVLQREQMFVGVEPASYYKEYLAGKVIKLQFEISSGDSTSLLLYKYNEVSEAYALNSTIVGADITPIGWEGESIYMFEVTPTEGTYYFTINGTHKSDTFTCISDTFLKKKLVKVEYTHNENDFGCIFDNFTFTNYFSGILDIGQPDNEIEAFESDYGEIVKLSSIPKRVTTLTITDIHRSLIDHIAMIFSLSNITVNGISYQNQEVPSIAEKEFVDIVDITVKLVQTNNTYYYD